MIQIHFHEIEIVIVLMYVFIGLFFNFYFSDSAKPYSRLLRNYPDEIAARRRVYLQRITGMVILGVVPIVLIFTLLPVSLSDYGILLVEPTETLSWGLIFAMVVIPLVLFNGKAPSNLAVYPQIRSEKWNLCIIVLSGLTWVGYILCYEFLFRGLLLFASQRAFGTLLAVVINILIYAMVHIPKGKFETIGAIPLGFVLCLVTIKTGSMWFAFIAHATIALSNEWIALYHNKDIELKIKF